MNLLDLFPDTRGTPSPAQLAARFSGLIEDVRAIAGTLHGYALAAENILGAPAAVRTAYLRLVGLADVHTALRVAQAGHRAAPRHAPEPEADPPFWPSPYHPGRVGTFFDSRLFPLIAPGVVLPLPSTIARPGPADPLARLLWLATDPEADPWLPSPDEQDARWAEFKAEIAARRRTRYATERAATVATRVTVRR